MKIALIFTPLRLRKNWSTLFSQDEHVGIMPPLSLAYVAAVIEKLGHKVIIIDAVAEHLSVDDTIKRIIEFSPDICGFTMTTYGFPHVLNWIKAIKKAVNIPVMVGGWHLSLYPVETMHHEVIDYGVIGEAEVVLPNFLVALENNFSLHTVKGIAFRENGNIIVTPAESEISDLDAVPFPARHLLDNSRYYNILSQNKNFTVMLSARGCPYRCIFCDLYTKKFRMRSVSNFVDEIEVNYKEFKIREFDIYDSSFTIDRDRAGRICDEILKRRLKVSWTARTRVDNVDRDLLHTMRCAGCTTVMFGIESADPYILKNLNKHIDPDMAKEAVKFARDCGIKTLGFFVIGAPGETRASAMKTIKFSTALGLDYVQFTRLTPFANTELYRMLVESGFGDYWREFTYDPTRERKLPLINSELSPQEAFMLVRKAYLSFYFRPVYLVKALRRIKTLLELKNSLSAGLGLIFDNPMSG